MIKFVVIGAGHIGKRHAEMILRNPDAQLVAMVDIRTQQECQATHFEVPFFHSLDALIQAEIPFDVANVCTPNGIHVEQTLKLLDAKYHVVCEKPMALSLEDAEKVRLKTIQTKKHVFCVTQNRYSPPSQWIKEVVDTHKLGRIFIVQINCFWNRDTQYYNDAPWRGTKKLDGGTLFTQFAHFIDIMYWLFGDITNIQTRFADFIHQKNTQFEDTAMITFDFLNGAMGNLNYSTAVAHQNLESSMTIIGEKGSVKIGGQYMNEVELCTIKDYEMPKLEPTNSGNNYGKYTGSAANHSYVIQNVVDTLKAKSKPTANVDDGLKVVDIIERIYLSNTKEYNQLVKNSSTYQ